VKVLVGWISEGEVKLGRPPEGNRSLIGWFSPEEVLCEEKLAVGSSRAYSSLQGMSSFTLMLTYALVGVGVVDGRPEGSSDPCSSVLHYNRSTGVFGSVDRL